MGKGLANQGAKPAAAKDKAAGGKAEDDEDDDDDEEEEEGDDDGIDEEINLSDICTPSLVCGFVIKPGGAVVCNLPATQGPLMPFRITNVCLGPNAGKNERATLVLEEITLRAAQELEEVEDDEDVEMNEDTFVQAVLGTLTVGVCENVALDVVVESSSFKLINYNTTETDLHVLGHLVVEHSHSDDEDYEDDGEEDDEDEDAMDEDDDEEDDDAPPTRVKIEHLDEQPAPAAGAQSAAKRPTQPAEPASAKRAKPEPASAAKPAATAAAPTPKAAKPAATPAAPTPKAAKPATEAAKTPASKTPVVEKKTPGTTDTKAKTPGGKPAPKPEAVQAFIMGELTKQKSLKMADLGSAVAKQFDMGYKAMGFEEKSLQKFMEARAGDKIKCDGTTMTLV